MQNESSRKMVMHHVICSFQTRTQPDTMHQQQNLGKGIQTLAREELAIYLKVEIVSCFQAFLPLVF